MTTYHRRISMWLLLLLVWACGGPVQRVDLTAGAQKQDGGVEPTVLVVTLTGKLGTQELARCYRTLRHGAKAVVFRLDHAGSQGEDQSDLQSLYDHVQAADVNSIETIAVLSGRVTQGAAGLALVCKRAYCLPGAEWGEVNKPDQEWSELLSGSPDQAMAERLDAARDAMAARLAQRADKLRPDAEKLALAMVDPRVQLYSATVREGGIERQRIVDQAELAALSAGGGRATGERPFPRPLMVTAQEAEEFGLSGGTLQGFDQLAEVRSFDPATIGELTTNWAEHMVGWLELLQPFLLVAGFLLLIVEIKTPGIGLPGLLGVAFLGLALFHSYLVGLAEVTEILVFFLGIAAIGVEIFLLPGTIVFGAVGFLCLVLSLVLSQQSFVLPANSIEEDILFGNLWNLTLLIAAVLVLGAMLWRVLPKVPWFNRVFLAPPAPSTAGGGASGLGLVDATSMALVGRVGKASTVLRPTGAIDIDGQRIDVVTEGEFIEAGAPVRVLYVQGTRVVVGAEPGPGRPSDRGSERAGERGSVGLVMLLCILGLALIVAEVMFVSFGVIATLSGIALLSAVFVAFQDSPTFGITMIVVEAVAAPIVLALSFKILPKTRFGKMLILAGPSKSMAQVTEDELRPLVGKDGVTLSPLRPAGFARIDGRRIDVVTRGEMLESDCPIVVLEVAGNRVVVGRR